MALIRLVNSPQYQQLVLWSTLGSGSRTLQFQHQKFYPLLCHRQKYHRQCFRQHRHQLIQDLHLLVLQWQLQVLRLLHQRTHQQRHLFRHLWLHLQLHQQHHQPVLQLLCHLWFQLHRLKLPLHHFCVC